MARIRTIKPDFFRHEELQDLEAAYPGQYLMLVFAALWGHCDKEGRFLWKPRSLKLDILPFLDFDLDASLVLLREAGLVKQYEIDGVLYGEVPTFTEHQRISGKEAQEPAKYPVPIAYLPSASQGSIREAAVKHSGLQEGKGREEEGNEEGKGEGATASPSLPAPNAKGTRLPDDWEPSPILLAWAESVFPGFDTTGETEKFRDWARSAPGQKGVKRDWDAAWRNWMRRSYDEWAMRLPNQTPKLRTEHFA